MALRPFTQDDFLALWRQVLPPEYTRGIEEEAQGAGFDIPALQAKIWSEFEANVNVSQQAYFLRPHSIQTGPIAASGHKAATTLQLYRAAPVLGDLLVRKGHVFLAQATDSLGGVLSLGRFMAVEEVTLPEGDGGPIDVDVEAEFEGYAGNVWEGTITQFEPEGRLAVPAIITATNEARRAVSTQDTNADRFNLGLVGRMVRLVPLGTFTTEDATEPRRITGAFLASGEVAITFDPPLDAGDVLQPVTVEVEEMADLGVTVTQPEPANGGVVDVLGAIGVERGIERTTGATDEQFAEQLVELPDVVSPAAIERIVKRRLEPFGIPWCLHESGVVDELMGFTWDLHPWDIGSACACGDEEPPGSELVGSGIVWLSDGTTTRFFIVCVGQTAVDQWGAAWDSTVQDGDAPNAWDLMPWDAGDPGFNAAISLLFDDLNKAREAGVGFAIILDESL